MPGVVACVDGSAYSHAVCDFAAFFADRTDADLTLLAVAEPGWTPEAANAAAGDAVARLQEHGFDRISLRTPQGAFLDGLAAAAAGADLIVMGKRGVERASTPSHLGSHVEPALKALHPPTCLVSQLFLPMSRALVVLDSDPSHRQSIDFATGSPLLQGLELDLLLMDDGRHEANEKLARARDQLAGERGSAFVMPADNADAAVNRYAGAMDILVLSREMLGGPAGARLLSGSDESFWRRRAPILIC
jgi:nucleotide-binding universal stress UspA family protein